MNKFADIEWAKAFLQQEVELDSMEEGTTEHMDLEISMFEEYSMMDSHTQQLVKELREGN